MPISKLLAWGCGGGVLLEKLKCVIFHRRQAEGIQTASSALIFRKAVSFCFLFFNENVTILFISISRGKRKTCHRGRAPQSQRLFDSSFPSESSCSVG